ncbi:Protein-associating with the carboxyl-terminal domain of ezrin [Halotydeus destructor]|nr:Protein-associating with the carboxyl-terminal domain of ezrin [Halotydeus destructor]
MGNDSSVFRKCHISSKPFYTIKQWYMCNANFGNKKLTVFILSETDDTFDVTAWKSIRHPFIVQYYDSGLLRSKRCIVTEKVEPVRSVIENLTREQIIAGLHDLLNALHFLHVTCNLSHNNVCADSIFVSRQANNSWKLGCLEFATKPSSDTASSCERLLKYKQRYASTNTLPPEDLSGQVLQLTQSDLHRRDSYAFGLLASELLSTTIPLPASVLNCRNEEYAKRSKIADVLADDFFEKCEYLKTKESLVAFASLSEADKSVFLDDLIPNLRKLPEELLATSVIPMLMTSRIIMLHPEAKAKIHPYILVPDKVQDGSVQAPLVSVASFESHIVPVILKLFCVKNAPLRLVLLEYLSDYAHLISEDVVLSTLLPQITLGLKDTNDALLAATFKAMGQLVHTFGGNIIVGQRTKIFSNDTPRLEDTNESLKTVSCKVVTRAPPIQTRSEPDGGEQIQDMSSSSDMTVTVDADKVAEDEQPDENGVDNDMAQDDGDANWSEDWTASTPTPVPSEYSTEDTSRIVVDPKKPSSSKALKLGSKIIENTKAEATRQWANIELDIQQIKIKPRPNELDDLFSQLEPEVKFSKKALHKSASQTRKNSMEAEKAKKFDLNCAPHDGDDVGWGDEVVDLDIEVD